MYYALSIHIYNCKLSCLIYIYVFNTQLRYISSSVFASSVHQYLCYVDGDVRNHPDDAQ